ncbi:MAG: tetratricopeptide repeat protein [Candidatus Adiutrix sp.]|jgi:type IV pilus biogenesis/stability protein PilW|nr:tetratricopeptide repeat protein [Candidatus Adiutrix sp.]
MTILRLRIPVLILALALALGACVGSKNRQTSRKTPTPDGPVTEEAQAQINLGAALLMQGEYVKALPELLRARELAPRNAAVENFLGLAYYYGQKEYDLAIESYQRALAINPERTDVHNNLGLVYLEQDKYEQALAEFNFCLKDLVYQNKHLPQTNIGLTYFKMKEYDQALAALTRAVEMSPNYANAYKNIGKIYMAKQNYDAALDYLLNAARLDDKDPDTFMDLGDLYERLGNPDEAAQAFSQVASLVPNTPMAMEAQRRARRAMGFQLGAN